MTWVDRLDVALAVAASVAALPTVANDAYAVFALPRGASGSTHALARVFRWLDARAGFQMATVSYLAVDYLLARLVGGVVSSDMTLAPKVAVVVGVGVLALAMMYPLLALYNTLGWLVWRNPPIGLDKAAHFAQSTRLEDPATFRAVRRELERVLAEDRARLITDVYQTIAVVETDAALAASPESPLAAGGAGVAGVADGADRAAKRGWRSFFLRVADRDVEANMARVPTLAAALRQMPEVYNALFSILDPGHHIVPHRGYFKGILRYHLGVVVPSPDDARLVCGGRSYHWREGDGVLFDDMFVHSVDNHCTSPRVVLFLDIRRPVHPLIRPLSEALFWLVTHHPYQRGVRARAAAG